MSARHNMFAVIGRALGRILIVLLGLMLVAALAVAVIFKTQDRTNGTLVSSGVERKYLLYVPSSYDPSAPTALVLSLHGFVEWPAHQMQISEWNDLADEYGFIVVYPSGTRFPRRWHAGGFENTDEAMQADIQFLADLIDELSSQYNIDPRRVYINGLSNGGGMSYLAGCALSEKIAAVGGVAGAYAYPLDACRPSRPVPMILFHGMADPIVPFHGGQTGGPGDPLPDIPQWTAARAALNGCAPEPWGQEASPSVRGVRYQDCLQDADVILYYIKGGGHTWPGGQPLPEWITGPTTQEIDASAMMWEFFEAHPLP